MTVYQYRDIALKSIARNIIKKYDASLLSAPGSIPVEDIMEQQYGLCIEYQYIRNNGLCGKTHHIRVDVLTTLVRDHISSITQFANLFEDDFVKIVVDEHYKRICQQQKKNQDLLGQMLTRDKELDTLYEKLYEEKVLGNLNEERFQKLSYKYEDEQAELRQRIKHARKLVTEEKAHEMNADGFLELVRKYTDVIELTPEILSEFIDKIVVHHRENLFGEMVQKVEIYYKMIGFVELPQMSKSEKENYVKCFSRTKTDRSA